MNELAILRRYVVESKDLTIPVNYFFDLMERNILTKAKDHCIIKDIKQHSDLLTAIKIAEDILSNTMNKSLRLAPEFFNLCPLENFYHGACRVLGNSYVEIHHLASPHPVFILYFADIQIGISILNGVHPKTDYFRFSFAKIDVPGRLMH